MPYKSKKQAAFMHINHPEIAQKWDKEIDAKGAANYAIGKMGKGHPAARPGTMNSKKASPKKEEKE